MTKENKKAYKCDGCRNKHQENILKTNKTPVPSPSPNSPQNQSAQSDDEITLSSSDITIINTGNRYKINIPTNNSFEELTEQNENYLSITSTPIGDTLRTCSDLRSNLPYTVELTERVKKLEQELGSAKDEIKELVVQNHYLKKQIEKWEKTHETKRRDDSYTEQTERKQQEIEQKRHDSTDSISLTKLQEITKNSLDESNKSIILQQIKKPPKKPLIQLAAQSLTTTQKNPNKHDNKYKSIHILGDEQVRGLSSALLNARQNKWNDVYKISSFIMSGATSTELQNHCDKLAENLSPDDIVILGFGSNDKDVNRLHSNLCIAVSKLNTAKVLIAPINRNPYLNEKALNYNMKLWMKHFENCEVINLNSFNIRIANYITHICEKINLCIDYNEYESEFISLNHIRKHNTQTSFHTNQIHNTHIKKCVIPKKGTIPYYFQKETNIPKTNKNISNTPLFQQSKSIPNQLQCNKNKTFFRPPRNGYVYSTPSEYTRTAK